VTTVRLIAGTQRSARSTLIDDQFIAAWGSALLVLPSRAAATARREQLMRKAGRGLWGNPVCDFKDFATGLLEGDGHTVRTLGDAERRLLLQACVEHALADGVDYGIALTAASPGLARHLLHIIGQLKQAAVEPDQFEARLSKKGTLTPMDRLVAAVYARYQEALKAGGAYDVPGLYWAAEAHCRTCAPALLAGVDAVFLDGFDDFTPSEFRLLEALRPHVDRLVFGVNHDDRPARQDCFRTAARTVDAIRERFDATPRVCEAPPATTLSEFVCDHLFGRDEPGATDGYVANVHLLTCPDLATEAELVARQVKAWLLSGNTAGDIAVVFPDLPSLVAPLRAAFDACGVPLRVQHQSSLAETAAGSLLLRLLRAWRQWAHEDVLDVLGSGLSPWRTPHDAAFPYLARKAQIISGFREWQYALESLQRRVGEGRGEDVAAITARVPAAGEAIAALLGALRATHTVSSALPETALPAAHAQAWGAVLDLLAAGATAEAAEDWSAVRAVLAGLRRVPALSPWSREVFEQQLEQALRETPGAAPRATGVLACAPDYLRNLRFKHVFLGGLVEGLFPRPPGINAIYSDTGRTRLAQAGIPLEGARERLDKERLLFHHVLSAASESLTLSWRLMKEDQREASPSPFLADVEALLADQSALRAVAPFSTALAPPPALISSERDLRHTAVTEGGPWLDLLEKRAPAVLRAAVVETQRHSAEAWNRHDGMLDAPDILDVLGADYGADHAFSVRRLETYRECPFRYFQDHVLRVETTETPEAEFDPRVRGIILHDVLEQFHRSYPGLSVGEIPEAEAATRMRALLDTAFEEKAWRSAAAPPSVRAAEHSYLAKLMERYLTILRTDDPRWKPVHFEVAFGPSHNPNPEPPSTVLAFTLDTAIGPLQFSGRIDRIDLDEGLGRIVDYKSGSTPDPGAILDGLSLQCTVYAWAVEQLVLPGTPCAKGVYIPVGRRVGQQPWREALHPENARDSRWAEREAIAREAIAAAVTGMRAGRFAPVRGGKTCHGCGVTRACRYDEARAARKQGETLLLDDDNAG
jgi:ATP-dependent helicase/DNAse subunit B